MPLCIGLVQMLVQVIWIHESLLFPWPYQSILSSSVNVSQCFGDQRVEPKGKQLELPTDLKRPGLGNSRQTLGP